MPETNSKGGGLRALDGVILVVGGVIAVVVAFAVLHFVAGLLWSLVKIVIIVAVIAGLLWLLLGRRKS